MILQEAKEKIYNSPVIKYVDKEKIEKAFSKIYVYKTHKDFLKAYGKHDYDGERLEGFNRNNGSHFSPNATVHTVIHEVLHELSSEFDIEGHRVKNGIMGEVGENFFGNEVNEGLTDYLAAKISGEKPRHYRKGHIFFSRIEESINKYYEDDEILFNLYLNHDDTKIKEFLDKTMKRQGGSSKIYERFLYLAEEDIIKLTNIINKSTDKILKRRNNLFMRIFNKARNKKEKVELLPEPATKIDKKSIFRSQYQNDTKEIIQKEVNQANNYQAYNDKISTGNDIENYL